MEETPDGHPPQGELEGQHRTARGHTSNLHPQHSNLTLASRLTQSGGRLMADHATAYNQPHISTDAEGPVSCEPVTPEVAQLSTQSPSSTSRWRRARTHSSPFWSGSNRGTNRYYSNISFSRIARAESPSPGSGHSSLVQTPERFRYAPPSPTSARPEPGAPLNTDQTPVFELPSGVSPSPPSSSSKASPSGGNDLLKPPKKITVRPDDSWLNKGPSIPDKSPLRQFYPANKPLRSQDLSPLSEPSDDEVKGRLTPLPLNLPKPASEPPVKRYSLPRTEAPPGAQGSLEECPKEVSPRTHRFVVKKVVSKQSITESNKEEKFAREYEIEVDSHVRRQRKLTLEALEGAPTPTVEFCQENVLKAMSPSEPSSPVEPSANSSVRESVSLIAPPTMDSLHPDSAAAMTQHRREAIRLAKAQERAVAEKCKRSNQETPGYSFDELIGKGSFGRVYKGRQLATNKVVAIKVLDIDEADFQAFGEQKDEQIKDFNREIKILRQAQESGAENLNQIIEALPVHSQLWMICENCPGGSVKTLMRATNDQLAEKYIIVVARELGKALKGLHSAGIIHRDVKCANVLIHEEGGLQLCDFGVANVLDTRTDKRRTFIGTLHWMPPELWTEKPEYSDEVDVWGYGCTIHECALGRPPNSDLRERQHLKSRMRRLKTAVTLPESEKDKFSPGMQSLIEFTLNPVATERPSMKEVLEHEYLADTETTHPTSILTELVRNYYAWLYGGGQRISLFMPGGAVAASEDPDVRIQDSDDWNFSMTQDFERRMSAVLEIPDLSNLSAADLDGEETPKGPKVTELSPPRNLTAAQRQNFEMRVNRGASDLSNLFDHSRPAYEYKAKTDFVPVPEPRRISDLPFRAMAEDRPSSIASNVIDLGDFDEEDYAVAAPPRTDDNIHVQTANATPMKDETFRLADASTLRQKRADSKGPRDPATQSLTTRRASSADDAASRTGVADFDFAADQQDWTVTDKGKAPELQPAFGEETTSARPGHATMDWSFSTAMANMTPSASESEEQPIEHQQPIPDGPVPDEPGPAEEQEEEEYGLTTKAVPKSARATLDWSFSNAMSELNIDSSAPLRQHTTPKRPTPLLRQMTMPVTHDDFSHTDMDPPRPSTALSEAYSDASQSSADIDPFGLEKDDDDIPGPAALDEEGISNFYSSRGHTFDDIPAGTIREPVATAPATSSSIQSHPFGRPARIGSPSFPGPGAITVPNGARMPSRGGSAASGSGSRPFVEVPEAMPPSLRAMSGNASLEDVIGEMTGLLESLQGHMGAASTVVQSKRHRGRSLRRGDGESEWEDEE